jgi:hypothetical protein
MLAEIHGSKTLSIIITKKITIKPHQERRRARMHELLKEIKEAESKRAESKRKVAGK